MCNAQQCVVHEPYTHVGACAVKTVFRFPNGRSKGRMVDALVLCGDEGRGVTAISFGEVLSNL